MKVVIQRVNSSSVRIDQKIKSEVERGLLVLVGICEDDKKNDVDKKKDLAFESKNKKVE